MEMLFGMPLPVTPGVENGLSSSYGTMPAPHLFLSSGSLFRSSTMPSISFILPANLSNAALTLGSASHAGSACSPMYSSSGECDDRMSSVAMIVMACILDGMVSSSTCSGISMNFFITSSLCISHPIDCIAGKNLSGYVPSVLGSLVLLRRLNLHGNLRDELRLCLSRPPPSVTGSAACSRPRVAAAVLVRREREGGGERLG
uniref:Uncharacterized protein n=1 Tax=Oryza rufipogon TaxID=4529 RepID=A0A0E0NB50_ORYRU